MYMIFSAPLQKLNTNISLSKQKNLTGDQRISLIFRDWSLISTKTYIDSPEQVLIVVRINNFLLLFLRKLTII